MLMNGEQLQKVIVEQVQTAKITDIHTHLFSQDFGDLFLWGIDEVLTYHYLVAEFFRFSPMDYGEFFALSRKEQADLIWQTLFQEHSPISEAQRGVLTILNALGLDLKTRDLDTYRHYFQGQNLAEHTDRVFELAGVQDVVMTNDPFDQVEREIWQRGGNKDGRFKSALRIDPLLNEYEASYSILQEQGYEVTKELDSQTLAEIRRFLKDWALKIDALYLAVSLPSDFAMPEDSVRAKIISECVLPVCRQLNRPMALMIGVKRAVNPQLKLAGDSLGKSAITAVEYLCSQYPKNKFLVTMLSKENQHELAITARKFNNLMIFGCWWFLNNPSLIKEITHLRLETLGLSFLPQHSDARVFEHIIYKWDHSRTIMAEVLFEKYSDASQAGWSFTEEEIARDIEGLFGGNFWRFING